MRSQGKVVSEFAQFSLYELNIQDSRRVPKLVEILIENSQIVNQVEAKKVWGLQDIAPTSRLIGSGH